MAKKLFEVMIRATIEADSPEAAADIAVDLAETARQELSKLGVLDDVEVWSTEEVE
jgi:capsular polysaccharide biosynthesis protein